MTSAAHAIIDLAAIEHNINRIRKYAPNAKIMAVIKANAYGHGLLSIAALLKNIDALAVARVDEGICLRKAGNSKRTIILEGFISEQTLKDLALYDLEVVVHSLEQVTMLQNYQGTKQIKVWLKLDSGMNRLGFKADQFSVVYQQLLDCSNVFQPVSLMTHLSCADDIKSNETTNQLKLFDKVVANYPGEKSIANSAGIIAWPGSISDWVRPGIMLYGVSPFVDSKGADLGLKPLMSLHSHLIAVKHIKAGESVGYAGTWESTRNTILGVVAIGYGDGYPRYAKCGTPVLVNGQRAPIVGRVSMDMITIDLFNQPDAIPGDKVTLWGEGLAVEEIAAYSDTIPYTLLCGITNRVEIKTR